MWFAWKAKLATFGSSSDLALAAVAQDVAREPDCEARRRLLERIAGE